jgi:hypothetical protein
MTLTPTFVDPLPKKPKLLFFQYQYDRHLPEFLLIHAREHVRCLSEFFDVTVISRDCDYGEMCDTHEPDLALFESGVNHTTCRRPTITNVRTCSTVPKLGLHNADGFCNARAGFLSDMDHWGIESFFTISTTTAEHTPEIADRLFVWPNAVDPDVYRDYGQWKSVPVLFTGNANALYPWRRKVQRRVAEFFPSLVCPHPGYEPRGRRSQALVGEPYARTINASMLAPACGTVAKEVVRKHFEIPACRCCLLTEWSPGLEAAGFVDMQNCIFADDRNVVDKLHYLFEHRDDLEQITDLGYQLVHSRHTFRQRNQILQWLQLSRSLGPHQRIVQDGPFGPLRIVERASGVTSTHTRGKGLHLALLDQGDQKLSAGELDEAERLYLKCMNYMPWMPEPKLRMALCELLRGRPARATSWLEPALQFTLKGYRATDPDPVEWAYYIVCLLCHGRLDRARRAASEFEWLQHPELTRVRSAVAILDGRYQAPSVNPEEFPRRSSIHQLPIRNQREWFRHLCVMLRACRQEPFAATLMRAQGAHVPQGGRGRSARFRGALRVWDRFAFKERTRLLLRRPRAQSPGRAARELVGRGLHRIEASHGYFLPYRLSEMRRDEFFGALEEIGRGDRIRTVALLGTPGSKAAADALLAGIAAAGITPYVVCIADPSRSARRFERAHAGRISCHWVDAPSPVRFSKAVRPTLEQLQEERQVVIWDVILIEGSSLGRNGRAPSELRDLPPARVIVLTGINDPCSHEHHTRLLNDPDYRLVAHNPELHDGCAIFKKAASCEASSFCAAH